MGLPWEWTLALLGGAVVAAVAVSWGVAPGRSGASGMVVAAAGSAPGVVGGGARGSSPPQAMAANTPAATSSTHQGFSPFMGPAKVRDGRITPPVASRACARV